jgi:hypothetical protein
MVPVAMSDIMIRCPVFDAEVQTGLDTETVVFSTLPNIPIPMRCSACNMIHEWKPRHAWVKGKTGPCSK